MKEETKAKKKLADREIIRLGTQREGEREDWVKRTKPLSFPPYKSQMGKK